MMDKADKAFYDLIIAQRNSAWAEIRELVGAFDKAITIIRNEVPLLRYADDDIVALETIRDRAKARMG